jgi:hypothetical protein
MLAVMAEGVQSTARSELVERLEAEGLLVLEGRAFVLDGVERALVSADLSRDGIKNVSLDPATGRVTGAAKHANVGALAALLERYAAWARSLIDEVAPRYGAALGRGRTTFRPRAVEDGASSPRQDDRRLHADAFPSRPVGAQRILRVFANVNPTGEARVWRVGEPFAAYARRWLPRARRNLPGEAWALERAGITKSRRTDYDALMLGLHDRAKLDAQYQATGPRREVAFPAGSTWIAFTDSLVHAAISGRCALEQTFYLPVSAMADEEKAPLRILERLTRRGLAP